LETANQIAKECGILTEDGISLEGSKFRKMNDQELENVIPQLQVLAKSTPSDKFRLVKFLKFQKNEIVSVTGDGTGDAPCLKHADIGLSMGLAGTEVAKVIFFLFFSYFYFLFLFSLKRKHLIL
jgi:P-type Ca2+ transporter type 2C